MGGEAVGPSSGGGALPRPAGALEGPGLFERLLSGLLNFAFNKQTLRLQGFSCFYLPTFQENEISFLT